MDVLLITIGSHGDVHPFIGIGRALKARGHHVSVGANAYFADLVQNAGLTFRQLGDVDTYMKWLADPLIWHPRKGTPRVMAGIASMLDEVYEFTLEHATFDTVIVGSSLAIGALVAAERYKLRYATAHLAPMCVRSRVTMPTVVGSLNVTRFPSWFKRAVWNGADRWFIDPTIVPALNTLRARAGLQPISHFLDWWNAPALTLGLWPDWFSPKAPDHPPQLALTGFPLYDEADHQSLDADLRAWLAAGDPPIAFTPGSAMQHGDRFFQIAAEACDRLDRRGLLLTRHIEQIPARLPPMVRHLSYAPFSELLPHCAAIVHHGGIGTTAQALRAGTPQLIMPMSHDQPDNGAHVKRLGVGDVIFTSFFNTARLAKKLDRLIHDPGVHRANQSVAARFANDRSMMRSVELIENLGA